jgi:hypothetical protein
MLAGLRASTGATEWVAAGELIDLDPTGQADHASERS